MTLDKSKSIAAMEVERCSKLGTLRLQQGFPDKALEAYRNAYQHAQTLSNHGYMVRACGFNLGAMLISTNNYIEGLSYLNKAIPPDGKRDGRSNGDLYFNYGLAYEGLKNASKSKHYYEMALKEYRAENDNVKMEVDTITRMSRLCVESGLLSEANDLMRQLTVLHSSQGDVEKEMQSRVERSNLLLKMGKAQEAEEVADECFKLLEHNTPSLTFAKMYSDLSVAYTQILHYDKAVQCSEKALPLVEDPSGDPRLAAVIYQNFGAIYNYMNRFEDAVKYHDKACQTFAKLGMRANQGHCFTNMGYAYSQLQEMDKAGESFLHGLQAARDCGDRKTEWQNLEALASVAFHKNSPKKAEQYYQQAIAVLSQSPDTADLSVHERLVTKLKTVIQSRSRPSPRPLSPTKERVSDLARRASSKAENVNYKDLETLASQMESGNIKVVRKGNQVRYLKVRRSGTLQKFQKVALGLDLLDTGTEEDDDDDDENDSSNNESESSSSHDSSDESNDEPDTKQKSKMAEEVNRSQTQGARPPDSYLPKDASRHPLFSESNSENNGSVEQLDAGEDYGSDDEEAVKRLMQKQLTADDKDLGRSTKQVVTATVHEPDTDSSASEYDSDEDDEDERPKPPVPDQSPQTTAEKSLRTYEKPWGQHHHHQQSQQHSIEHKPPKGQGQATTSAAAAGEEDGGFSFSTERFARRSSDKDGVNYFHDDELLLRPSTSSAKARDDGPIYESLHFNSSKGRKLSKADRDSDGNELSDEEMAKMSRGEKDVLMYKEFQSANKQKEDEEEEYQKSKHCIVM